MNYINNYMQSTFESSWLYTAYETCRMGTMPMRSVLESIQKMIDSPMNPVSYNTIGKSISASCEMLERLTRNYEKPEFDITSTIVGGETIAVEQTVVMTKPFCRLLHFRKNYDHKHNKQQKLLIVAPLSGHHATLLRGTVIGLLPHFDVYITDWTNARDVPVIKGKFDLDDFIDYTINFLHYVGTGASVMAVCQPTVPVLAAVALMAAEEDECVPKNMILVGGPVDTRKSPTEVNEFAQTRTMNWFEHNLITRVPLNHPGAMRAVYPGFIQLSGFMSMNLKRHIGEHIKLFQHLVQGDGESAESQKKFYNEYLAVLDIPAEFYLQTIQVVFKDYSLPKGEMISRGRAVNPSAIKDTSLLILEGEFDDISGVGQTKAAIDLCRNIPADRKLYHLQKGVGHYGIFNGSRFREQVVPVITKFCYK